jgi:hypothetical protein
MEGVELLLSVAAEVNASTIVLLLANGSMEKHRCLLQQAKATSE